MDIGLLNVVFIYNQKPAFAGISNLKWVCFPKHKFTTAKL